MNILRINKLFKLRRILKTLAVFVMVLSNLLAGLPAQQLLNIAEESLKDQKVVDLMYWATKDQKVVDSFISNGNVKVIKEAKAAIGTHTEIYNVTGNWVAPPEVTTVDVEAWGGGGAGAGSVTDNDGGNAGGGGGAYARTDNISVIGGNTFAFVVGAGGTGGTAGGATGTDTTFNGGGAISADGGTGGGTTNTTEGVGGSLANTVSGDEEYAGGNGGDGGATTVGSGGGGGSAGDAGTGGAGGAGSATTGGTAGTAGAGTGGAAGGAGQYNAAGVNGSVGSIPGGAGSGASVQGTTNRSGGSGARGALKLTYDAYFPKVEARSSGNNATNTTSHTITMPSGITVGELLLIVFSTDGIPTVSIGSGGWTKLSQTPDSTNVTTQAIFYKIAAGSDTATVTTSASEQSSHIVFRISSAGNPTGTGVGGNSTNSNPASHNPLAQERYLWISTRGGDASAGVGVVPTLSPANFANLTTVNAGSTSGATTATSERMGYLTILDPGTFTSATEQWVSYNIAIPYSGGGGRVFTGGFETQSLTVDDEWSATSGSPTITTSTVRSGAAALQITGLSSGAAELADYRYSSADFFGPIYVRFYFRYATLPTANNRIFTFGNAALNASPGGLLLSSTGTLILTDEDGTIGSASSALTINTWHRVEIFMNGAGTGAVDTFEGRLDGSVFATSSTRDIATGSNQLYMGGNLTVEAQTQGDWFFDDVAINSGNGAPTQSSYPGEGSIVHLKPNADGTNTAWTASGCASDYLCVDEIDPDDGTTMYTSTTLGQEDDSNLESSATAGIGSGDTITLAAANVRMNNSGTSTQGVTVRILDGSSNEDRSPSINAPNTTWFTNVSAHPRAAPVTSYTLPESSTAITATDLDSFQLGVRVNVDAGNNLQVSTLWLAVEYVPNTAAVLTQNDWRLYEDNDATNPTVVWATPDLAENEALAVLPYPNDALDPTDEIRIRMNIAVTSNTLSASTEGFILQYKEAVDCTDGTAWTDVDAGGGGGAWRYATSGVSDGVTITPVLSVSDVAGRYSKSDPTSTNPNAVSAGQDLEWDWHLEYNGTASARTYCFRMIRDDATTLSAYNSDSYPKLDTRPGVADLMRHGNFFSTNVEKGFYWAN